MKKNLFIIEALLGGSVMAQGANEVALIVDVYTIGVASPSTSLEIGLLA